jgi:hypothetical protein
MTLRCFYCLRRDVVRPDGSVTPANQPGVSPSPQLFLDTENWDTTIKARLASNLANDSWWVNLMRFDLERAKQLRETLKAWVEDLDDQLDLRESEVEAGSLDEDDYLEWEPRALAMRRMINRRLRMIRPAGRLLHEQEKARLHRQRQANTEAAFRQQEQARAARADRLRVADEFTRESEEALRILAHRLARAIYLHREQGGGLEADEALHSALSWSMRVAPDKEVSLEENVRWWLQRTTGRDGVKREAKDGAES